MTHQATAPSAGSTKATGASRGPLRRALATRAARSGSKGTGAPSSRRLRATLAVLALAIAAFAVTAAPASASTAEMGTVSDPSYASAHVTGKVSSTGIFTNEYFFQYCTAECSEATATWTTGYSGSFFGVATDEEVEGPISVPKGGTKYFVRLVMVPAFPDNVEAIDPEAPGPYPEFTTLPVDPPTIPGAVEASPVFSTSAKAIGKVKRPANPADPKPGADDAFDVSCHFEYITDDQYKANELATEPLFQDATPVPCTQNPIKQADAGIEKEVDADFAPGTLTPATTYHLRLVAENAAPGVVVKDAPNFTTAAKVAAPTVTATDDASEVKFNSAKFTGKVLRPAGADPALNVNCHFEYVTDAAFQPLSEQQKLTLTNATGGTFTLGFGGETTTPIAFDASAAQIQSALESLSSIGTGNVSVSGAYTIDFTGALASKDVEQISVDPSALEEAGVASAETATVAEGHVGGFENPQTALCAENTITAEKVDPGGEMKVSAKAGLVPTTKYHLRLVAENEGGSDTMGAASTFTTPEAEKPVVTIDPVEGGTFTTAQVSGTIDVAPGHTYAYSRLEISSDNLNWSNFEVGSPEFPPETGGLFNIEHTFTGLQPSTTYSFRIASKYSGNSWADGEANGEVAYSPEPNPSITTEPPSAPATAEDLAVTDVTATTAHFSGTVNPNAPAGPLSPLAKKAYATKWHFECTPECKDANGNVIGGTIQGEEGEQPVFGDVKRLEPGTEYEVRLIVSSEGGGETKTETFPTSKIPPSVKQTPGASDGEGGYTLQGVVNPNKETITDCEFKWGPNAPAYAFSADCSPMPSPGAKPTTVEAHLTSLNPDVDYHALLVVKYKADSGPDIEIDSGQDQKFKATFAVKEPCPANEQIRAENSSLALPECRAYEMVSPPGKEGFGAGLETYDGGDRVAYYSQAGNIAKSGQNASPASEGGKGNQYVAARTGVGWKTIPDLNGISGSFRGDPTYAQGEQNGLTGYSPDLRSSVWYLANRDCVRCQFLRSPDGTFTLIGSAKEIGLSAPVAVSSDLSHLVTWTGGNLSVVGAEWGRGVYEFVGPGMDQPRRVDLDNSGAPISSCIGKKEITPLGNAKTLSVSADGSRIVNYVFGGCGAGNPPVDEIWARVNGTTSVDVSASHCDRTAADPGGVCNGPAEPGGCFPAAPPSGTGTPRHGCRDATFEAATPDGSRVFFTTNQQLVNADTDQTNDIYACDIPAGNPAPTPDKANHCTAFRQVSAGDPTGAEVENVLSTSKDGSTVYFTAKGQLTDNDDALGEEAVAGDHNLYVWRTDVTHPDGQTIFVGRLDSNDLKAEGGANVPQATADGRYLVFTTSTQLLDTDTDSARDVYRYDADTGDLTRASTNVFGVAGNDDGSDAQISRPTEHQPTTAISDDGQKIVFTTTEALSSADGNDEPDVYLWTPNRVSLITTGSSGYPLKSSNGEVIIPKATVTDSGRDLYFETAQPLAPADDNDLGDVYDARVGGGFSFAPKPICTGETCKPSASTPPAVPTPAANRPKGIGNVVPKTCPRGKILKGKKCVKKNKHKKYSGKKHHGKKASHKQGGGK